MDLVPLLILIIYLITSFISPIKCQRLRLTENRDKLNYLYNFLNRNGHKEMCSLIKNSKLDNYLNSFEYTLISPTDEAFSLIPLSIKQQLNNDTEFRLNFIKNHIINGRLFFKSISNGQELMVNTVSNNRIHILSYPNGYVINGAQLLASDRLIEPTPNLAQFVDKPIYLKPTLNLIDYLNQNYKQMLRFIEISGLQEELQNDKERTYFIPSDDAFRSLSWPVIEQMYNNNTFLKSVLKSHILNNIHYSLGLQNKQLTSILRTQNGDKLNFKTKKLQGRNVVFINDIPIINADQLIKNGVIHEISKINLPKQLIDDCNCIDDTDQNLKEYKNANLLNKNILIDGNFSNLANSNNANSLIDNSSPISSLINYNNLKQQSTIIPESMKRKYINLHNKQYNKPNDIKTTINNKSDSLLKPMVFYDRSDPSYFTTVSPKLNVNYNNNHNYYNSNYSNLNRNNNRNQNFFFTDDNSLAYPANSLPSYSLLPSNQINKNNVTLESPFLTIFDPFSPYANQTLFSNPRTQFHSSVNVNQSLPSMTHYLTHIYHENDPTSTAFIYNMERLGIPIETTSTVTTTTFKPYILNTKPINIYQVAAPTKTKIKTSSKYYNDLTTPTPMYFDPTRKPKSPSYVNRIRRVNDLTNPQQYLQTSYQVLDSNVVQKIEDTKTSSNNNQQQIIVPPILNQFRNRNRNRPSVSVSSVSGYPSSISSSEISSLKNQTINRNKTPFITLLDVVKNPYLMINNERIEFTLFENLLNQTNLVNLLKNKGQLTLILPTNSAFKKLKNYELEYLNLKSTDSFYTSAMKKRKRRQIFNSISSNRPGIKNLVLNHISPILVNPDSIIKQLNTKSYSNFNLQFSRKLNKLYLNEMPVLATTIVSNGVAYVVDNLLINKNELLINSNEEYQNLNIKKIDTIFNPSLLSETIKLNDNQSSTTTMNQIENLPNLSFFTSLLKKSNYSNLLNSSDHSNDVFTILAPENKAFSYLTHQTIDLLKNSQFYINKFVANHLINANFSIANLIVTPIVLNLNKIPIKIDNSNGMLILNDTSLIKKTNIPTHNGFIHILTHILPIELSPLYTSSDIMLLNRKPIFQEPTLQDQLMEIAKSRSSSKFLKLFIQHNYINTFIKQRKSNFTLILPSDIAYYSLPENFINKMENNSIRLKTILNYHIMNQLFDPTNLQPIDQVFSSTDLPLHYLNVTNLNEQKLNIFMMMKNKMNESMINESIIKNDTNDQLENIRKLINELKRNPKKNQLTISGATIKEIKLIELDNKLGFVEILFVDRVLYTPKGTIYDLIKSSPILSLLKELIDITNLRNEIDWNLIEESNRNNQTVGYTFFAPSNSAFERLGLDIVEQLKRNTETAKVFLLRHLIRKPLYTSSIPNNGSLIENSTGEHLNLQRSADIVAIEGVIIEIADLTSTNGVVHVIQNVL